MGLLFWTWDLQLTGSRVEPEMQRRWPGVGHQEPKTPKRARIGRKWDRHLKTCMS
ncbi:hypothetical protein CCHR01_11470 [Colletotrichum chrysophilum]|uniref:Uncharacterized protein n=1 Tax=Colletotrichum chrysophilum TaxID=1836956 RepID=A0AAD9AE28_9PEZI|nr:hypothetical protein CCHR01_11470 [Colletotrichum chrysophilum]